MGLWRGTGADHHGIGLGLLSDQVDNGDGTVNDTATRLMWQKAEADFYDWF